MELIYIIERQSLYDGGGFEHATPSFNEAKRWVEKKNTFRGWEIESEYTAKSISDDYDFWYEIIAYDMEIEDIIAPWWLEIN